MSLRVDGTGRRTDGRTPRALLGVHLHEVKGPKQMLWAATLWEEGVLLEQLPCFFDDEHARPEKLTEVLRLRRCRSDMARHPDLDFLGQCLEVRHVARLVLADFVIGRLVGGHHFWWRWWQRGGGRGEGGREGVCVVVLCLVAFY